MTAQEIRRFRDISKKLVEAEERGKLLKNCVKCNVGLGEDENSIYRSNLKFRVLGNKGEVLRKNMKKGLDCL